MDKIDWKHNGAKDDYTARVENYLLRVEKLGPGGWWFTVYFNDKELPYPGKQFSTSKNRAMGITEGMVIGHKFKTIGTD